MPSSYTPSLRLVLPATGENTGTWGDLVNNGLTSLVEASIAGSVTVNVPDANVTLTAANEAPDQARAMFVNITGTVTGARTVFCPAQSKLYVVHNGIASSISFAATGGAGVILGAGARALLYCNGVNVIVADGTPFGTQLKNAVDAPSALALLQAVGLTGDQSAAGIKTWTGQQLWNGAAIHNMGNVVGAFTGIFGLGGRNVRKLTAGGNIEVVNNANSAVTHTLADNGDFTASGNVTAFSDIRLKTDLTKIGDALAKVNLLTGYTYTRTDTGARQTGLVAQDVQRVLPEAVLDGEHLSVAYGNLMGLMVEAIKELSAKVEALEGR